VTENPGAIRARGQKWFFLASLACALAFLAFFPRLAFPLASAYVVSLVVRPFRDLYVAASPSHRLSSVLVLAIAVTLLVFPLGRALTALPQEISEMVRTLPRLEWLLRMKAAEFQEFMWTAFRWRLDFDVVALLSKHIESSANAAIVFLPRLMGAFLEWLLLTPLFLWFLLRDGSRLRGRFLRAMPNAWFERGYMLFHQFNGKFGDYITAKTLEASIVGVLVGGGLWAVGFPHASLLGVLAGVTNILPYVGPVLGWLPALLVGLLRPQETNLLGMNFVYLVANLVDMALVFPLLVSKIVNLHPLVVVSSVVVGSQVAGVGGMLVSVPVAAFLKLLVLEAHRSLYPENTP
jgi:putative permease